MSRTSIKLSCKNPKEAENTIQDILSSKNYNLKEENDERYYQNGMGLLTAPKFISYSFDGNDLTLEGWVRNFAFAGESNLNGIVGALPKKRCKSVLDSIVNSIDADSTSIQKTVVDNDERTFLQKLLYKYDAKTNNLRISKTKVITWIWFAIAFIRALLLYSSGQISMNAGSLIFVSLILALILTIPVYVVGRIIAYFLDKR